MVATRIKEHMPPKEGSTGGVVTSKRGRRSKRDTKEQEGDIRPWEQSRDNVQAIPEDGQESNPIQPGKGQAVSNQSNVMKRPSDDGSEAIGSQRAEAPEVGKQHAEQESQEPKPKKRILSTANYKMTVRKRRKVTEASSAALIETVKAFDDGSPPKLDSSTSQSITSKSTEQSLTSAQPLVSDPFLETATVKKLSENRDVAEDAEKMGITGETPRGPQRSKHKRFDGEENNDDIEKSMNQQQHDDDAVARHDAEKPVVDSDEEAPEEETTATGEARAKAAAAHTAETIQRQAEEQKEKRRKRDQELKQQASTRKKRKRSERNDGNAEAGRTPKQAKTKDVDFEAAEELARSILESGAPLPDDLPEEILVAGSRERPPKPLQTPPLTIQNKRENIIDINRRKAKRLDAETNLIRDKRSGGRVVRVLPQQSVTLPPKAMSKAGSSLKEQWLKQSLKRVGVPGYKQKGAKSFLRT